MKKILVLLVHFIWIIFLTVTTQIGGVIWCMVLLLFRFSPKKAQTQPKFLYFIFIYILISFILIPPIAKYFGRTPLPISKSNTISPHTYYTVLLNRHYVTPQLKSELEDISIQMKKVNPKIKTVYLDANFPFWDGFPLLPHLSHNDGKKIDLSFIYSKKGKITNEKPSRSGYGYFEGPTSKEYDQSSTCKKQGYWQYDFPKYLTLGSKSNLKFNANATKKLINHIIHRSKTHKVFIEPHLKQRMNIKHSKLRFHGCRSVRHDDHIHYQIK